MKRRLRFAFAIALVVAVTVVAASAIAFAGHDSKATPQSGASKARTPAAAEQIRVERRDSFLRTGCSKHMRHGVAPDV
jgi:FlaG/FlaF family flagellin (archaellin)